ncbi:glycosyltransferase [Gymnodinialimonas sp. 2305UL16-5]|uniref:glycosyltransferase n=1 Tax=Gymnodinialimonas mytili TaxID=3126503 RepID=UPI003098E313
MNQNVKMDHQPFPLSPIRMAKDGQPPINAVFAGGNGFPPEDSGGVQSSTHDLATRMVEEGHNPSVLAPLYGKGLFGLIARTRLKISGKPFARDMKSGYPVNRAWFPEETVSNLVDQTAPDVAIVQCHGTVPIAQAFRDRDVPLVIYLRNVEFNELGGDLSALRHAEFIANSEFTARTYQEAFGIAATVIPPTINREKYEGPTSGDFVTFVNPVAEKGVERAIEIAARCPDIPFLFVESWLLSPSDLKSLGEAIRPYPNIRFEHRTDDIRTIYGRTRIVLAPSKWAEAWGRIASEAHCSGIPVVGSTSGGLPEAIGPGGIALDYTAPIDDWVAEVRRLWDDPHHYRLLSDAARIYARRSEVNPELQFQTFMTVLRRAIDRHRRGI